MKKAACFLLLMSCLLVQCSHHKLITGLAINPEIQRKCLSVYPIKPFRVVHKIEADLPFGGYSSFIGVTEVHPASGLIKLILLSPEGITLLDAENKDSITTINSAMPPLDRKDFTLRIFESIRFIYERVQGVYMGSRMNADNSCSCVWKRGDIITQIRYMENSVNIDDLNDSGKLIRQAIFLPPVTNGLYSKMILEIKGITGYRLTFDLLEYEDAGN
jgi:hypothetical protein